jgi:BirA family biotin operon repressor/biotin-[acetyl-CoA-carboxylase] ligase
MVTPLAIVDSIIEVTGVRTVIKWPNDVQVEGKKVAGILMESGVTADSRAFALVGAGINVNFDPRTIDELRDIATSLSVVTRRAVDREALLASYLRHHEVHYDAARAGESPRDRWRTLLVTLGKRVLATETNRVTEGIAVDVDEEGALIVRTDDDALVSIEAGDVTLRR